MRSANWIEETTTSIAGTSGDGAVTLTAVTNTPRFSSAFGTQATTVRYVIEKASNGYKEEGIGSVASNVLTRTRPQVTWDGTTYDDSTPSSLAFGSTPTSGDVLVRISPVAESLAPVMPGANGSIAADSVWRDYPITNASSWNNGGSGQALTADREYYTYYRQDQPGNLTGAQFEVTTAVASSNLKWALYSIGHDGLPAAKITDFTTTGTASTGVKTDTATGSWSPAGPIHLPAGWYAIGFICSHAASVRGFASNNLLASRTPLGRQSGYGYGNTIYNSGNYTTGMPSAPTFGSGTMIGASNGLSVPWFGLRVVS